jgi:PAS domain-containing protein
MVNLRCTRCGTELELGLVGSSGEPVISHGLCQRCARSLLAQRGVPLVEYLDGLGAPVAVVDHDGVVRAANEKLCELLSQDPSSVRGKLGGDVFECEYAALPEGCGRTIHCSACAIRRTVTDTFDSGISRERVPASLRQGNPGQARSIDLLISTERVGSHVLMRIDMLDGQSMLE